MLQLPRNITNAAGEIQEGTWEGFDDVIEVAPYISVLDWAKWVERELARSFSHSSLYVNGISCIVANIFVGGSKTWPDHDTVPARKEIRHSNLIWIVLPTNGSGMDKAVIHVYEPMAAEMETFDEPQEQLLEKVCFFGFHKCHHIFKRTVSHHFPVLIFHMSSIQIADVFRSSKVVFHYGSQTNAEKDCTLRVNILAADMVLHGNFLPRESALMVRNALLGVGPLSPHPLPHGHLLLCRRTGGLTTHRWRTLPRAGRICQPSKCGGNSKGRGKAVVENQSTSGAFIHLRVNECQFECCMNRQGFRWKACRGHIPCPKFGNRCSNEIQVETNFFGRRKNMRIRKNYFKTCECMHGNPELKWSTNWMLPDAPSVLFNSFERDWVYPSRRKNNEWLGRRSDRVRLIRRCMYSHIHNVHVAFNMTFAVPFHQSSHFPFLLVSLGF